MSRSKQSLLRRLFCISRDHGKSRKDITGGLPNGTDTVATMFSKEGTVLSNGSYAGPVYRFALSELH